MTAAQIQLHLQIIGVLFVGLALVHVIFPKYFNWKKELKDLSLMNRQMMKVHTFFIAFMVLLMGVLCLHSHHDLVHTTLGKTVSLGLGIFWGVRLLFQFFGYSSELWRGRVFETVVHVVFSLFWVYLTFIFLYNYTR